MLYSHIPSKTIQRITTMYTLEITGERGVTYLDYPSLFAEGELLSRREISGRAGRHYSTVMYHLERAVTAGLLAKVYCYIGNQPGWGYCLPGTRLPLPGVFND